MKFERLFDIKNCGSTSTKFDEIKHMILLINLTSLVSFCLCFMIITHYHFLNFVLIMSARWLIFNIFLICGALNRSVSLATRLLLFYMLKAIY